MGTHNLKNFKRCSLYLTHRQDDFINQVITVIKEHLDPVSKINRSDVVRTFVDRFANVPQTKESKVIFDALAILAAKELMMK